ncbi:hypothetical protein [Cloacibacillus sp. An23]|uniref:hypothetical protein n=1 Tax=Cloacibacillus sp. An23 TaxID=1965591 RepID=UPI000B39ED93|nr:hypothetical protein [Cloacibacillus sp. An23]OUO90806.1 hypothetical protein B5F39_13710 [Cloacibacillus sp. An23]
MKKSKFIPLLLIAAILSVSAISCASAASFEQVLDRWTKSVKYIDREDDISNMEVKATYYSAEFIEAYIQREAEKNLWTQQETEDYKYKFLQALRLDEMIPIQIEFINNGPTMHLGPFDIMVKLLIKNKSYKPADYDKRFNFAFQGQKEGLIYFPRYDEKTGKDLLEGVKSVTLELRGTISPSLTRGNATRFQWDVANDDPTKLYQGTTAARIETDRLIKRLENLRKDESSEQARLDAIKDEINTIQSRLDELSKNM